MALPPRVPMPQQQSGPPQQLPDAGSAALHQAMMNARLAKRPMMGGVGGPPQRMNPAPSPQGGAGSGHKVTLTVQPHIPPAAGGGVPRRGF